MAFKIATSLISLFADSAALAVSVGLGSAAKGKEKELKQKISKLKQDIEDVGDLYDNVYAFITLTMKRFVQAVEQLPNDILSQIDNQSSQSGSATSVVSVANTLFGVGKYGFRSISTIVGAARSARSYPSGGDSPEKYTPITDTDNPWRDVSTTAVAPPSTGTTTRSKMAQILFLGVDVAGPVFSIGALASALGAGITTLQQLDEAIAEIDRKQQQMDNFRKSMVDVLNELTDTLGLQRSSNYDELVKIFKEVKRVSEIYEQYSSAFKYAIKFHYIGTYSLDEIKRRVQEIMNPNIRPLADSAYAIANELADGIRQKIDQGKSDKEIIEFYMGNETKYQHQLDEYFISSLRWGL